MMPETWLPTCTVVTAEMLPVAVTFIVTSPRLAGSVRYLGVCSLRLRATKYQAPPPTATTAASNTRNRFIVLASRTASRRRASMDYRFSLRQRSSARAAEVLQPLHLCRRGQRGEGVVPRSCHARSEGLAARRDHGGPAPARGARAL